MSSIDLSNQIANNIIASFTEFLEGTWEANAQKDQTKKINNT
ncbi:MAG: hypothetical protein AAF919_12435 [Pseudomonadota bacterium]